MTTNRTTPAAINAFPLPMPYPVLSALLALEAEVQDKLATKGGVMGFSPQSPTDGFQRNDLCEAA
ncbi:hypothetical protein ABTX62_34110 [Streptomyces sp. NPDC096046]|uniref:hypothetical protein n=1 Tax=Streptomyces sp. NPDC096046 TaxID=3155542 RepID=UPI003316B0C6